MNRKSQIIPRRRQTDWQTHVFNYVGLPPLLFGKADGRAFDLREILKPRFAAECLETKRNKPHLNEKEGIRVFCETFEGKTGLDLESAAAELLLPENYHSGSNDLETFCEWVARRAQPLDKRLIEAFGRFYVCRLNNILKEAAAVRQQQASPFLKKYSL